MSRSIGAGHCPTSRGQVELLELSSSPKSLIEINGTRISELITTPIPHRPRRSGASKLYPGAHDGRTQTRTPTRRSAPHSVLNFLARSSNAEQRLIPHNVLRASVQCERSLAPHF